MKMKRDAGLGSLWPPDWPMGTFLEAVVAMVRRRAQFTKVTNGAHLQVSSILLTNLPLKMFDINDVGSFHM
jgi:hypothetical protein